MAIVLVNAAFHSFVFETADGEQTRVSVERGQRIDHLGIPIETLSDLISEHVVGSDGKVSMPRYTRVPDHEWDETKPPYVEGVTTVEDQVSQADVKVENQLHALALAKADLETQTLHAQLAAQAAQIAAMQAQMAAFSVGAAPVPAAPVTPAAPAAPVTPAEAPEPAADVVADPTPAVEAPRPDRETLEARAAELGIVYNPRIGDDKLAERVAAAEAAAE